MTPPSTLEPRLSSSTHVRRFDQARYQESWVTGVAPTGWSTRRAAEELFDDLVTVYSRDQVQPIQEKIYGTLRVRDEVLAIRRAALRAAGLDPDLPCSYYQGRPADGGELAGLQAWGVTPLDGSQVVSVEGSGRLWSGDDFRLLYLPAVRGLDPRGELLHGPSAQAEQMFSTSRDALERQGFSFRDVRRTWIYVARLLDWYGELNRVRSRFFRQEGVGQDGLFPASTGIQGVTNDEECAMDVLAIQAAPGAVAPILHSDRQGQAFSYGSAFSRGMRVGLGRQETVFVSGTASIGPCGRTRHLDQPDAQILETLLSISALLEQRGARLGDVQQATLFCKTAGVLRVYRQVTRLLGIPDLPVVPIVADVCRPDLLVEIEAVAVVPREAS